MRNCSLNNADREQSSILQIFHLIDMIHLKCGARLFHIDTISGVSLNFMNNCGLNLADKRCSLSGPLAHLVLTDMADIQSRPSTFYRNAISDVSSNSVQNCDRNPADKDMSTDGQIDDRRADGRTDIPEYYSPPLPLRKGRGGGGLTSEQKAFIVILQSRFQVYPRYVCWVQHVQRE